MVRTSVFPALRNAFAVILANLGTVLVLCGIAGVVGSLISGTASDLVVDLWLKRDFAQFLQTKTASGFEMGADQAAQVAGERLKAFHADPVAFGQAYPEMFRLTKSMPLMIVSSLSSALADALWMGTFGALVASATIYLWVQREKGRQASLGDAVNYALARWKRVVGPHLRSVLFIQFGMQLIVPGILFALQRAFVDAIATLDDRESDPIARSKRLTSSRRGLVLRTFLVACIWWGPYALVGTFLLMDPVGSLTPYLGAEQAAQVGPFVGPVSYVLSYLVLCLLDLCMVQYYLDIFRKDAPPVTTSPAVADAPVPAAE